MPRVSVLFPVRDAAATLARSLGSILDQTWRDFEVIAVNDHSTDNSAAILAAAAARDPRVRVINAPDPGGIVIALETAARAARGDLLARMDADDFSHPTRLEKQVQWIDTHPEVTVVGCQVRIVRPEGAPRGGYQRYQQWLNACVTPEQIARERFIESPIAHPTALMRRAAFERIGGYRDVPWAEDYDLWLRMLDAGQHFAKVPEVLFDWLDAPTRLSRGDARYSLENFHRAKAHHLARLTRTRDDGVTLWGAGPIGKRMARLLAAEGVAVHRFVEVNPRRIGKTIGGVAVIGVDDAPTLPRCVHLGAVGQPGRRDEVRRCVTALGAVEGEDFFCVA